ncbi:MAG: type II toxin-antitoxin system Phd/YefM family antitoxin [Janthinobacterium lividum]
MREITLQAAADGLDGVVAEAMAGEDVVITRDGRREAVLVSWTTWQRLSSGVSFGALLTNSPLDEDDIAPRSRGSVRDAGL